MVILLYYSNIRKIEEGEKKGITIGKKKGIIETAKNMLKDRLDINLISKYTGLPKEEIEKLY